MKMARNLTMIVAVDPEQQARGDIRLHLQSLLKRNPARRGQFMGDAVTFLATIGNKSLRDWGADELVRFLATGARG